MLMGKTIVHGLKLLRNFLPSIVGYVIGGYFALQYYNSIPSRGSNLVPIYEMPEVINLFWISVIIVALGILLNLVWIFVLAKLGVE